MNKKNTQHVAQKNKQKNFSSLIKGFKSKSLHAVRWIKSLFIKATKKNYSETYKTYFERFFLQSARRKQSSNPLEHFESLFFKATKRKVNEAYPKYDECFSLQLTQKNGLIQREGSSLLIALLITSLLVFITVSLNSLISSETRQISNLIKQSKAEYLAESGSEIALYLIHQNTDGFEPNNSDEAVLIDLDDKNRIAFKIDSSTDHIPIVEEYIRELALQGGAIDKSALFDNLELNESITIPLLDNTRDFEVEYYFPIPTGVYLPDWDILLWKIFGQDPNTLEGNIDSMSEYLPAFNPNIDGSGTTAYNPAKLGTQDGWTQGYFFKYSDGQAITVGSPEDREDKTPVQISSFLNTHQNNYLILTNALNPTQLRYGALSLEDASSIKYRICTPDCKSVDTNKATPQNLVPFYSIIEASGEYHQTQKNIRTSVNHEGFLPVFDFAIYRTKN